MARLARAKVFAADEVGIVHVMNRVVRRCFLLGDDPVTGKNYDHRKQWKDFGRLFSVVAGQPQRIDEHRSSRSSSSESAPHRYRPRREARDLFSAAN